jgi:hypothetical protein
MPDFGRLRSYDRFSFPYTPSCESRLISWQAAIFSQLQTERSRYLETWEVPKAWWAMCYRTVHNRAAACVAAGGNTFENQL